ncbi:MAG: SDR family oxidoreductase [Candidatus Fonsibacter lacus]|jgi:3-hydroxybutyrate dehydrogenase|uniref:SDR family oxidoreductase n=1 Tax=Candidatus Fonsibacter lacus TaxID=2576439 RepID=A0A845S4X1_9PROT|nr:SDR family oxidoreductase [Candidatus Fonsibacter lacus]NCU62670.1 SDR family oxidoreductase [Candidatus Fonsibacter lacus]
MNLEKTILVTGSTSGIGLAITEKFYGEYYNVVIVGKAKTIVINKLKKNFDKDRSLILNLDLTKVNNIKKLISAANKKFKKIDVLVNCAGMQVVSPLEKYPEDIWRKLVDINLNAAFYMTKYILPVMRKNKWGRIINIASTHGLIGSVNKSAYTASKHGIVGLTKVTALETAKEKITCNSICPGFVLTEFIQDQIDVLAKKFKISNAKAQIKLLQDKQPSLRFVQKTHIADLIYFLCSDSASEITGANIPIDGGWTAQ